MTNKLAVCFLKVGPIVAQVRVKLATTHKWATNWVINKSNAIIQARNSQINLT